MQAALANDHAWGSPLSITVGYRGARGRAHVAMAMFGLRCLLNVLAAAALLGRVSLVQRVLGGTHVSIEDARASDTFVRLTAWAEIGAWVLLAVVFLMWLHRVVSNNRELRAMGTRFSPAYAVGCWFIPFANLVLPFQAVREARKAAADPSMGQSTPDTRRRVPTGWVIPAWWLLFIASGVMSVIGVGMTPGANSDPATYLTQLAQQADVSIATLVVALLSLVLGAVMVWRVTASQESRAARLGAVPPQAPEQMAGWDHPMPPAVSPPVA